MEPKKTKKQKYQVLIYEQPYGYEIEAESKEEAEELALIKHNGGDYDEIDKIKVKEVKSEK